MLILGIDPGSRHTGFGLVESQPGGTVRPIDYGRISCPARTPIPERIGRLASELESITERWHPDVAVLETPFLGLNAKSLVVLAQARGALMAVLVNQGVEIAEYSPAEVKNAVSGNGRADKEQVKQMVRLQLSLGKAPLAADASDALALAICYAHRYRMDRLVSR
ncbi:MAG: crossover junction endodeoxyribonuclease RuvC [Acidobacteriota bacterium]